MKNIRCDICGRLVPEDNVERYNDLSYCPDCANELLTTCDRCGAVVKYEDVTKTYFGYLCECCYDELFG